MDTLLKCPRCDSFVQPTWPSCKICGYDPSHAGPYEPFGYEKPKRERVGIGFFLGALATLVLLVGMAYGLYLGGSYLWEHRVGPVDHQQFVSIEH